MNIPYQSFLKEYLLTTQQLLSESRKKLRGISILRLFLFLLAAISFYLYFRSETQFWLFTAIGTFLTFIVLVKFSADLREKLKDFTLIIEIVQDEINYCEGRIEKFETGEEFIDHYHEFSTDLDIFGSNSLFHRLSRSSDRDYKEQLSWFLKTLPQQAEITNQRQSILRDLADRRKFRLEARALLNKNDQRDKNQFKYWLNTDGIFTTVWWKFVRSALLLLSLTGLTATVYYGEMHPLLLLSVTLNLIVLGLISKKVNYYHKLITLPGEGIEAFVGLSKKISEEEFDTLYLRKVGQQAGGAKNALAKLKSLISLFDQRLNGFLGLLLNVFFVYDLWIIRSLEKWKKNHAVEIEAFLKEIESFKIYETLANYTAHHNHFIFPDFSGETLLKVSQMSHPFLSETDAIRNDFEISENDNLFLVTGANMAGKSTFLRAVGLNWVMGMIGLPVCAQTALIKHVDLMTSMRINDSLSKGTSYFKAEVERLRDLIDLVSQSRPSMVLLDEILRGTNSNDKRIGTIGFCNKLLKLKSKGILATHDLEVADHFEGEAGIRNINFESYIVEGQLIFDYKLRPGIAQNTNASTIMKARGIID